MPGQEQLDQFVEQPGGGDVGQQVGQTTDGCFGVRVQLELQLGRQSQGPQHAYRVLTVTGVGIADDAQPPGGNVFHAAGEVQDAEVGGRVVQGVDGEVAPEGVGVQFAEHVVAQDAAILGVGDLAGFLVHRSERRHLDDLASEAHVDQAKASTDDAAVAEQFAHLFGSRAGGHVEILGLQTEEQVAHAATHQIGLEAGPLQPVQDLERVVADVLARHVVLIARDDAGRTAGPISGVFRHVVMSCQVPSEGDAV